MSDNMMQYKNIKFQVWDLGGQSSIRYATLLSPGSLLCAELLLQTLLALLLSKHFRDYICH